MECWRGGRLGVERGERPVTRGDEERPSTRSGKERPTTRSGRGQRGDGRGDGRGLLDASPTRGQQGDVSGREQRPRRGGSSDVRSDPPSLRLTAAREAARDAGRDASRGVAREVGGSLRQAACSSRRGTTPAPVEMAREMRPSSRAGETRPCPRAAESARCGAEWPPRLPAAAALSSAEARVPANRSEARRGQNGSSGLPSMLPHEGSDSSSEPESEVDIHELRRQRAAVLNLEMASRMGMASRPTTAAEQAFRVGMAEREQLMAQRRTRQP